MSIGIKNIRIFFFEKKIVRRHICIGVAQLFLRSSSPLLNPKSLAPIVKPCSGGTFILGRALLHGGSITAEATPSSFRVNTTLLYYNRYNRYNRSKFVPSHLQHRGEDAARKA